MLQLVFLLGQWCYNQHFFDFRAFTRKINMIFHSAGLEMFSSLAFVSFNLNFSSLIVDESEHELGNINIEIAKVRLLQGQEVGAAGAEDDPNPNGHDYDDERERGSLVCEQRHARACGRSGGLLELEKCRTCEGSKGMEIPERKNWVAELIGTFFLVLILWKKKKKVAACLGSRTWLGLPLMHVY